MTDWNEEEATRLINQVRAERGLPSELQLDFKKELYGLADVVRKLEKDKAYLLDRGDYSVRQGTSRPQSSPVEGAVIKREKLEQELARKKHLLACLEILPIKEKSLLYRMYVRREGRVRICADLGITERTLSARAEKALFTLRYAYYSLS